MSAPEYSVNIHNSLIKRINASKTMDEANKIVLCQMLSQSLDSTNGRTTEQKIQDLTVTVHNMLVLAIARHLDADEYEERAEKFAKSEEEYFNSSSDKPKWQIVLTLLAKSWPLATTILGIAAMICFKPTIVEFLSKFFGI